MDKAPMTEERKASLIRQYAIYNKIDWIIFIAIMALFLGPVLLPTLWHTLQAVSYSLTGLGAYPGELYLPEGAGGMESAMALIYRIPMVILAPMFIVFSAYNIWSFWLYVKVWPIKEVPKGGQYWLDWLMSIGLTAYELFMIYAIVAQVL